LVYGPGGTPMTRAICTTSLAATALAAYLTDMGVCAIVTDHMGLPTVEAECPARVIERAPGGLVTRYYRL
jgi:hypothetical protein